MIKVPKYAIPAIFIAVVVSVGLMLLSTTLYRQYTNRVTYPAYMESLQLEPGDIGAEPTADTPLATSIAEFEAMDTTLFYTIGRLRDTPYVIDGKNYYELELENEESVLVRVDWDSTELLESPMRRMPVGRWVPLTEEQIAQVDCPYLDVEDHYLDMKGDFDKVMTEGEYFVSRPLYGYFEKGTVILMLVLYIVLCIVFRKRSIEKQRRNTQR